MKYEQLKNLYMKKAAHLGMVKTATSAHRTLFRMAIRYKGAATLNSDEQEIQTKDQLREAIFNFLDDSILSLSVLDVFVKKGGLVKTIEQRHKEFIEDYGKWYTNSIETWREIIRQGHNLQGINMGTFAKYLLEYYRDDQQMDDLVKLGIEKFRDRAGNLVKLIDNLSDRQKQTQPIKHILLDLISSEAKLRDADVFVVRLFINTLSVTKK